MIRFQVAVIGISLAATIVCAADQVPASKSESTVSRANAARDLVRQRAAQEKLARQARLAARKQPRSQQPRVFYPGEGFPAQPLRDRIDYEFPRRAAQSLGLTR